jgi:glucose/arabinose dehydrogenase
MKKFHLPLSILTVIIIIVWIFFHTKKATAPVTIFEPTPTSTNSSSPTTTVKTVAVPESPLPSLSPQTVTLKNGTKFSLNLPAGYSITPAAEGFRNLRFMAWSPDDRLFVAEMYNRDDTSKGRLLIFENFNEQTKKFEKVTPHLDNLRNPNSVAFYTDASGKSWLYLALTDKLVRYTYTAGETKSTSKPEILATFPDYGLSYKYGGWHLTRTVKIIDDKVYVSVGSSCNSCEEKEAVRASIIVMNPDGSNQETVASGLRNAVGLTSMNDELVVTNMGADHLGSDRPEDTFYKIESGENYGWPFCYQYQKKIYADTTKQWNTKFDCSKVPVAPVVFPAHSAPLGLYYFNYEHLLPYLNDSFLVALHGSGTSTLGRGYKVVQAKLNGEVKDFITGFIQKGKVYGRPVDIIPYKKKGLFITDDHGGVVYYVDQSS